MNIATARNQIPESSRDMFDMIVDAFRRKGLEPDVEIERISSAYSVVCFKAMKTHATQQFKLETPCTIKIFGTDSEVLVEWHLEQ